MVMEPSLTMAKLSGKLDELKDVIDVTCSRGSAVRRWESRTSSQGSCPQIQAAEFVEHTQAGRTSSSLRLEYRSFLLLL